MSAWDCGVNWRSEIVTPPTGPVVSAAFIREKVLKQSEGIEDTLIEQWIRAAEDACESDTGRAVPRQTRAWIADRFPAGKIVLGGPPLVSISSFTYVDADGEDAELAVSPAGFLTVPSGRVTKAELHPLYGQVWPVARCQPDAVRVEYLCGYDEDEVPAGLITGIGLMVAELDKIRTLSVHEVHNTPSLLDTKRFWRTVF